MCISWIVNDSRQRNGTKHELGTLEVPTQISAPAAVHVRLAMSAHDLEAAIDRALGELTPREQRVLRTHFGLDGDARGVPGVRVVGLAVRARALRKLRLAAVFAGENEPSC